MSDSRPIGVFDSGLGGLTVLKALKEALPNEQFIYYGDTAHLPYGEKSEIALQGYVRSILHFLARNDCKFAVVACNSASTVLNGMEGLPFSAEHMVNVIDPVVDRMKTQQRFHDIGVIGTRKTIDSGRYHEAISAARPDLRVRSRMTPLLVPMIEEGFIGERELFPVFDRYFNGLEGIDLLIPACTHYPIIFDRIETYFEHKVKVLHAPKIVAEDVAQRLRVKGLECTGKPESDQFHVSDLTESFKREAEMFLGRPIVLERTPLDQ